MWGIIKRNVKHLTVPTFVLLYTSMVRSHLFCVGTIWKGDYRGSGNGADKSYENSIGIETAALQWKIESLPDTNPTL